VGNRAHKYVPVFLLAVISCCRVPSLIFHFQISTITRWMTDTMAKYQKITDYQAKYLDVSKGIIDVLEKNDRQMEYLQYDIKVERHRIDSTSGTLHISPAGRTLMNGFWRKTISLSPLARVWMMPQSRP